MAVCFGLLRASMAWGLLSWSQGSSWLQSTHHSSRSCTTPPGETELRSKYVITPSIAHLWSPLQTLPPQSTSWVAVSLEEEVLTQIKGHHISELNADHLGEREPNLWHTSLKFFKALCGNGCYKSYYLLMGFEPETPTCCFEIFCHLFISAKLIYLFRAREVAY